MPTKPEVTARKKIALPPGSAKSIATKSIASKPIAGKSMTNGTEALDLNHLLYALQAMRV